MLLNKSTESQSRQLDKSDSECSEERPCLVTSFFCYFSLRKRKVNAITRDEILLLIIITLVQIPTSFIDNFEFQGIKVTNFELLIL